MKKTFLIVAALVSFTAFAFAGDVLGFDVTIDVAPNVLNLQSTGDYVTVHTNILYDDVDSATVMLKAGGGSIPLYFSKRDLRDNFVAKFRRDAVIELDFAICEDNTFTLTGFYSDGEVFSEAQDILVIDNDLKCPR